VSLPEINDIKTDDAIRQWASERRLPDAHLQRWLLLTQKDRTALLGLAETLRLRTGQFMTAFELLEEIALRERASNVSRALNVSSSVTISAILSRDEIRQHLDASGSAPGRARELIDTLRALRFPRLKRTADRLAAEIAALKLPGGVRVVLPKELSSDEVRIEISAHGGRDLERLVDAVAQARGGLGRIADLIGGADSIDDEV
jgi:hypothetical protein